MKRYRTKVLEAIAQHQMDTEITIRSVLIEQRIIARILDRWERNREDKKSEE